MAVSIQPYTERHMAAVCQFNQRLRAGGVAVEFLFPEHPVPEWLPPADGRPLYQELFLVLEGEVVRGGYVLKHQDFIIQGKMRRVGYYHGPISEGLVEKAYAMVGMQMLRHALRQSPLLYALGMGAFDRPLPQMLRAMGWSMFAAPFFFKVNHPARFLRQMQWLRKTPLYRFGMDLAAFTGIGWLAVKAMQARAPWKGPPVEVSAGLAPEFSDWADSLWEECKPHYALAGARDSLALRLLYPAGSERFLRLRVTQQGATAGWAVLTDTTMRDDKYFGNLRVGAIVDVLATPQNAGAVVKAATELLRQRGVDLIVSNQAHEAWCGALRDHGFLSGPSNFIFAASQKLAELLAPFETNQRLLHINRGDGDGPIHL